MIVVKLKYIKDLPKDCWLSLLTALPDPNSEEFSVVYTYTTPGGLHQFYGIKSTQQD